MKQQELISPPKEMTKLACGFAGGMGGTFDEGTCGAVTGALIANGILNDDPSQIKANAKAIFNSFKEEYGTVRCDIISKKGEDKSPLCRLLRFHRRQGG